MPTFHHQTEIAYGVEGQGIPLLLMHAFPLDRSIFGPVPGARQVTFDSPGAGESALPSGPVRMDAIADIGAALLDHLGIARAVVGGVSMGGYAGFAFAGRHPQRLLGLILADTRAVADTPEGRKARYEMVELLRPAGGDPGAAREGLKEVARRMLPRLLGRTTLQNNPALVERLRQKIESASPEGTAKLLEALAERPDSTSLLKEISVPALVMRGEEDAISSQAECEEMARALRKGKLVVVPGAGHLPNLEQPALFEGALADFLAGLPP